MSYQSIIHAISSTICNLHLPEQELQALNTDDIAAGVSAQQKLLPDYLPLPITILTCLFEIAGLRYGGRFSKRSKESQQRQMLAWKQSRIGLCRNFVRFYESLTLLVALQDKPS